MSTSTPETKDCPFCAERIKAAAIKCRHCGSDLTHDVDYSEVDESGWPVNFHGHPDYEAPLTPEERILVTRINSGRHYSTDGMSAFRRARLLKEASDQRQTDRHATERKEAPIVIAVIGGIIILGFIFASLGNSDNGCVEVAGAACFEDRPPQDDFTAP